ncbi:hypothetical protein EMIT0347P_10510 [Pseudomonas sp. IT-347P]
MNALATQFHPLHQQGLLTLANVADAAMGGLVKGFLASGKLDSHDLKAFTYGEVNGLLK